MELTFILGIIFFNSICGMCLINVALNEYPSNGPKLFSVILFEDGAFGFGERKTQLPKMMFF
jgi:hypothetical protein